MIAEGDRVRQGHHEYEVLGVEDVYLWLKRKGHPPFTGIAKAYDKIEPFFEPGKTYRRWTSWSITAQLRDVFERFECTQVERNGSGSLVAFGRCTVKSDGAKGADCWIILSAYDYNNHGWQEQP